MGVDTNCPNCNARLYLGTEFERTTCDRCPCISWLVVEWHLPGVPHIEPHRYCLDEDGDCILGHIDCPKKEESDGLLV